MKIPILSVVSFLLLCTNLHSQGLSNQFLLGYADTFDIYTSSAKARIDFNSGSPVVTSENRKMRFYETQGNISDAQGNLLMSSNGVWIANANGDTMMNGSGLSPGQFTDDYADGLPIVNGCLIIPFPGSAQQYVLFHMTANYSYGLRASELYYSIIDMTLDGGLGGVILKNQVAFQDTMSWGVGACRHANGRDWWIVALKDSSDIAYKILFTPDGIHSVAQQHLGNSFYKVASQLAFSPDGNKFAYSAGTGPPFYIESRLFDFDRCSGQFSNYIYIPLNDSHPAWSAAFSPDSKHLYVATTYHVFQINTDTTDVAASLDSVATNDGYYSPAPPFLDSFYLLYLAPDGKIYITSGNSVVDLHVIDSPDYPGIACDVLQHSFHLPCYHSASVPNHPNYFLGPVAGSSCDSLFTSASEKEFISLQFNAYPVPASGLVDINYSLEQNKTGMLRIFNVSGEQVYSQMLPQWSTHQRISIAGLPDGIYEAVLYSGYIKMNARIIISD